MCTTKRVSMLRHGVTSYAVILAVCLEVSILCLIIYTQVLRDFLDIRVPPPFVWAFGPAVGIIMLVFTEVRKYLIRHGDKRAWYRALEF